MKDRSKNQRVLHPSYRACRDQMLTMVILAGLDVFLYGLRPLIILLTAAAVAVICDLLNALLRGWRVDPTDLSSVCYALIFAFMMPASCNYLIVVFGSFVTVMIGKWVFGGWKGYPFHPSAFGFTATAICFSDRIFTYPKTFTNLSLGLECTAKLYTSPSQALKLGAVPLVDISDMVSGDYCGPMGMTFFLILVAAMIFLILHKEYDWQVSVAFYVGCAVWAFIFPRISAGNLKSVVYELLSGGIAFSAAYLVNEPTIVPKQPKAMLVYGFFLGIASMIFSRIGVFSLGTPFALLLLSPLTTWLDRVFTPKIVITVGEEENSIGEAKVPGAGEGGGNEQ
ncbi:MAG: RnfABCDGE type electron transport complex subunit D [Oscillospiraceae bacterium]|jgi:electron transport complex protein RnfD